MGPCEDTCGTLWAQKTRLSLKFLVGGGRGRAPKTGSAPRSISDLCPGSQIPGAWRAGCSPPGPSAPVQTRKKQPEGDRRDTSSPGIQHAALPILHEDPSDEVSFSSPCIEHVEPRLSCGQISVTAPDVQHGAVLWEAEGGVRALHTPPRPHRALLLFQCWGCSFQLFFSFLDITCHLSLLSPGPPSIITISASNTERLSCCPLSSLCPKQE